MEAQASGLRELLEDLGVREFYLGAHDFGGPVALTMLRLFPRLRVRGLVLTATNAFTDTYVPPPLRLARVPLLGSIFFHMMAGNRPAFRMMHFQACAAKENLPWERFARHLTDGGIDLTRRIFQRSLADLKGNYQAIEDLLPQLDLPTVVVWGDKDPFFAVSVGERTTAAIPKARLVVYEQTGHFVPEEQPELLAADILRSFQG
jgi:pimeloyl-ACP methyl ester carboxylesterase